LEKPPLLGITMGDPAGVGPEIIIKALARAELGKLCRPVVFGDPGILNRAKGLVSTEVNIHTIQSLAQANFSEGALQVLQLSNLDPVAIIPGRPNEACGKAMARYIIEAVAMALEGPLDSVVTCPINKGLLQRAGYSFEGHTQMIAHLTGTHRPVMMLAGKRLKVSLVTIHCALRDVPSRLSVNEISEVITTTCRSLIVDFGITRPRIGVAGLNPHAGEEGLFGDEELNMVAPAIEKASKKCWEVKGPLPADTLFWRASQGEFDAVVAMYHDQGLAPFKLLHFSDGVNVTLGLPIVRTSVDHGTAYDLAGKGVADPGSLISAIEMAATIVRNRKKIGTEQASMAMAEQ